MSSVTLLLKKAIQDHLHSLSTPKQRKTLDVALSSPAALEEFMIRSLVKFSTDYKDPDVAVEVICGESFAEANAILHSIWNFCQDIQETLNPYSSGTPDSMSLALHSASHAVSRIQQTNTLVAHACAQ